MAKKNRIQAKFYRNRKELRKQLNCKYPKFLPEDGGVERFERESLTTKYFITMFNSKYNKNEKQKAINAPKKGG